MWIRDRIYITLSSGGNPNHNVSELSELLNMLCSFLLKVKSHKYKNLETILAAVNTFGPNQYFSEKYIPFQRKLAAHVMTNLL